MTQTDGFCGLDKLRLWQDNDMLSVHFLHHAIIMKCRHKYCCFVKSSIIFNWIRESGTCADLQIITTCLHQLQLRAVIGSDFYLNQSRDSDKQILVHTITQDFLKLAIIIKRQNMPRAFLIKNRKEDGTEDAEEEMMTESPGSAFTIVKPKHPPQLEGMFLLRYKKYHLMWIHFGFN